MNETTPEALKPVTAYVPEHDKRRLRVLAAQMGETMSSLANKIYYIGLDLLEEQQKQTEEDSEDVRQAS